jgi:HxlR-like helix-turn-helix protein
MPVSKKEISPCPLDAALSIVDGRWKGTVLWRLSEAPMRTGELRRSIPDITERVLIRHLKDLVRDGILLREEELRASPIAISTTDRPLDRFHADYESLVRAKCSLFLQRKNSKDGHMGCAQLLPSGRFYWLISAGCAIHFTPGGVRADGLLSGSHAAA